MRTRPSHRGIGFLPGLMKACGPGLLLTAPWSGVCAVPALQAQVKGEDWKRLQKEAQELAAAGKLGPALQAARQALPLVEQAMGPMSLETASVLDLVGEILTPSGSAAEAEQLHLRALALREKVQGPTHLDLAKVLVNLGGALWAQGRYAQVAAPMQRAIAIQEQRLGAQHPALCDNLNGLAQVLMKLDRYAEAEALDRRALQISERTFGPEHSQVAACLNALADLEASIGHYAEAEPLFRRALAIREKTLGADHPEVAQGLQNLGSILRVQGKLAEAEPPLRRALAILEMGSGPESVDAANLRVSLAILQAELGRYAEAEANYRRALANYERFGGPEHPDVAVVLNNLGVLLGETGRLFEANPMLQRALAIREKVHGPEHATTAVSINNLAANHAKLGQYAQAEALYKRALAAMEARLGPDHPNVASPLDNLATLYDETRQNDLAEALHVRALALYEKAFGPGHPNVALALGNLGTFHRARGNLEKAEPLLLRDLAIREKALGAEHPSLGPVLNELGILWTTQGRTDRAEAAFQRALTVQEKALGREHPAVALTLLNKADLDATHGRPEAAGEGFTRASAIFEKALGPDHPRLALSLHAFAGFAWAQGNLRQALALSGRSLGIYRRRWTTYGSGEGAESDVQEKQAAVFRHLRALAANPEGASRADLARQSFDAVQVAQATGAARALAQMAARFSHGDDALAALVRQRQDATREATQIEALLLAAASQPPGERKPAMEQSLREALAARMKALAGAESTLASRFPEYQSLVDPGPMSASEAQDLLRPGEAMIVYALAKDEAWAWVVRTTDLAFTPLQVREDTLRAWVARVRQTMVPGPTGRLPEPDREAQQDLYQALIAPLATQLKGAKNLLIVPAGPLQSLPFGLLEAPSPKPAGKAVEPDWLVKRAALSMLPTVSSLRALRRFAKASRGTVPFIGFGDPVLKEAPAEVRAGLRLQGLFRSTLGSAGSAALPGLADVEVIRSQDRLPESAGEIRELARILRSGPESIWLGDRATELNVKTVDLSKHRVVAFATHGVMANELGAGLEPGLLLTPPVKATPEDDGYLSAGEIAQLKLNADWVLLSACNTASADGKPGAEGLSGLAKAFFYAGSRALLVSHWPVASDATVALTTATLREYQAHPERGKAEAHRRAMLRLMRTPGHPEWAHPFYWAPFVVVGEGGPEAAKR